MYEYSSVLLVEVFDGLGFRVKFNGSRHGGCKFLVREIDSC